MKICNVALDPVICKDMHRIAERLLGKAGFRDSPYGALNVGLLIYELFREQLPVFNDPRYVAYHFEIPSAAQSDEMAAIWSVIAGKLCSAGHPFGLIEEDHQSGVKPFMSVQPREGAPANSNASTSEFRFHTDNAVLPECLRPQRLSLACLVNEANAATGLIGADEISAALPPALARIARQHRFVCAAPPSYGDAAYGESEPRAVLSDRRDGVHIALITHRTRPFDENDKAAADCLREIERLANENAVWVNLQPGQILIFDNARAMHARQAIDERPRRLIRGYWSHMVQDLDQLAATDYAHYYSAATALSIARSGR